jgi:hypothetical protein
MRCASQFTCNLFQPASLRQHGFGLVSLIDRGCRG